ncbi:MAG TPA: M50 family metallopeptidase [Blastocatellia bacterium]|nr:M50 family metallopeptidase [Blastocatellia bacterium]
MQSQSEVRNSFRFLLFASALTVALWFLPLGDYLTYPIHLFVTLVHEIGHALGTLLTLGKVNRIALDWNGGGVTETVGGARLLISSAGYLSATLYGAGLLLLLRRARNARAVALGTAVMLLAATILFGGNIVAWSVGLTLGAGFLILGLKGSERLTHFLMSFLGVQSILNAFSDLRTLIYLAASEPGRLTDAQNMAKATDGFVPAIVWAIGWSLLSLLILSVTLMLYYRSLRPRESASTIQMPGLIVEPPSTGAHRGSAGRS